jgi:hypothetical protein
MRRTSEEGRMKLSVCDEAEKNGIDGNKHVRRGFEKIYEIPHVPLVARKIKQ